MGVASLVYECTALLTRRTHVEGGGQADAEVRMRLKTAPIVVAVERTVGVDSVSRVSMPHCLTASAAAVLEPVLERGRTCEVASTSTSASKNAMRCTSTAVPVVAYGWSPWLSSLRTEFWSRRVLVQVRQRHVCWTGLCCTVRVCVPVVGRIV